MAEYSVLRQHFGDRLYMPGDARTANDADVAHLVESGVLVPVTAEKAAPVPKNKAMKAPKNKAAK